MSFLLELDESKLDAQLIPLLESFDADIAKAEPLFNIEGQLLEVVARTLPQHQAFYHVRACEAKQLMKWLENHKEKIEGRLRKNYERGQRAYTITETNAFLSGEREMVEHKQLIIEATLAKEKLEAIVEAFRQMGWMVGNVVKLRVASLQDVVL
jgi:DNA topoisomerase VI subunit B